MQLSAYKLPLFIADLHHRKYRYFTQTLRILKITAILLLIAYLQVGAKGYAQTVTWSGKDVPIEKVFKVIKKQTGYVFFYNYDMLRDARPVSIDVKEASLQNVLQLVFKDQPFDFSIEQKTIVVTKKLSAVAAIPQPDTAIPVHGRVTDEQGSPLPSVSVWIKGTQIGTTTDENGAFSINARQSDVLMFSIIGYERKEAEVVNRQMLSVILKAALNGLHDLVVVGYGTQRAADVTGSIVSVKAKDIENSSVADPYQSLQGKLPGLRITQSSGQPGAEGIGLNIRGPNSFASDNSPLVLINGVVGDLSTLDPSFIESVTVLKDASSAAIYGARAANGVILVTTKTGANASRLDVEYNASYVTQSRINWPKRVWNSVDFMNMWNTAIDNAGGGANKFPQDTISRYENPSQQYPSFNWENYIIKPIHILNNSLSIGGKTGNTSYQAAMGIWNQDGIVRGFNYKKYTGMFNLESQVSKKFKIGITANGIVDDEKEPYDGVTDDILSTIGQRPYYRPFTADGTGHYAGLAGPWGGRKSPVVLAKEGGQWINRFGFNGTAYTQLTIIDGLMWEVKGGMNYNESDVKWQGPLVPMYDYWTNQFFGNMDNRGSIELSETNSRSTYYTIYSTLNYTKTFLQHYHLNALLGVSQEKSNATDLEGYRRGFASESLDVLSAAPADGQTTGGNETDYALQSFFGRLNLNYKDKYLVEANFRRDGSSRFPPADKYAFFPSFSAGWMASQEPFIANNLHWLDELKIRASYGQMGNDNVNGNYPYQSVLSTGASYPFSNLTGGVVRNTLANDQLKWESTSIRDIGLDLNIKNSLLYTTLDYYIKTTSGILRRQQIPGYAGVGSPVVNEGKVQNKGYELILGHKNHIGSFNYGVEFNISAYKNKVVKFGAPEYGGTTMMKEGYEMNRYYMYEADGIYQSQDEIDEGATSLWIESPGDVRIRDVNGDGKITPDDRVDMSGANPNYYYGLNLYASWKGFDITLFFQGEQGRKVLLNGEYNGVLPFTGGAPLTWWEDAWTPDNQSTTKPKMDYYYGPLGASTRATSTFWLENTSYSRLKNLTLGYTLPSTLTRKFSVQRLRVFFSGENLFTFTKFQFGDPESGGGISYPMLRSLTFGLNVRF